MGKYSNLIFLDADKRIVSALKTVDFTTSSLRQVLPGMTYELPPKQDKNDPLLCTEGQFYSLYDLATADQRADKFIITNFLGISSAVAREIAYRASGDNDITLRNCTCDALYHAFCEIIGHIKNNDYHPSAVYDGDRVVEYAFCRLTHYSGLELRDFESPSKMLDTYFEGRDREVRVKQKATDILKILTNSETRLLKKMDKQRSELEDCKQGEKYKKNGDLITSNIYAIERGMKRVELIDYEDYNEESGEFGKVVIELDSRLSPSANAQRMYKRYNKCKNAERELAIQIEKAERELNYIYSVFDALAHAENASDLVEIRDELYTSGYASKMKNYRPQKRKSTAFMKFKTTDGYTVLCGKNNIQNENITFNLAHKSDYWFHVKNKAGSHVVMLCNGEEPDAVNFTEAAEIAAYYSSLQGGVSVPVDYTFAKNVKKIQGANPGLVIYHTNWTAYVTPSADKIAKLRES
jgi:predicted ribosome quality control (RQC) complex YloA/Tae2 family protein